MTSMLSSLTLQVAGLGADTIVTVPARDGHDLVASLAAGSVAATFLGILVLMLFAAFQMRKINRTIDRAKEKISLDPAVQSLRRTAGHVESISKRLDDEVAHLANSVTRLSDRLRQASDRMEERIEELNALMEVVQDEAESAFIDGAATARGVRAGIGRFGTRSDADATRDSAADADLPTEEQSNHEG